MTSDVHTLAPLVYPLQNKPNISHKNNAFTSLLHKLLRIIVIVFVKLDFFGHCVHFTNQRIDDDLNVLTEWFIMVVTVMSITMVCVSAFKPAPAPVPPWR